MAPLDDNEAMSAGEPIGSGGKGGPVKAVILAGGYGSRLAEETSLKPKPMIEIGGRPILWHILKIYSAGGVNDFVICCGYKGYVIKEYFANYFLHMSDVTFDMAKNTMEVHQKNAEPWRVTLVDTARRSHGPRGRSHGALPTRVCWRIGARAANLPRMRIRSEC